MKILRPVLIVAGIILAMFGLLFIGQGLGYVRWPASSFMIDMRVWVNRGVMVAIGGLVLILVARRLPRR